MVRWDYLFIPLMVLVLNCLFQSSHESEISRVSAYCASALSVAVIEHSEQSQLESGEERYISA